MSRHFGKRARRDPGHSCARNYRPRASQPRVSLHPGRCAALRGACGGDARFREGRHQGMTRFSASSMRQYGRGKERRKEKAYTRGRFLFREVAAVSVRGRREWSRAFLRTKSPHRQSVSRTATKEWRVSRESSTPAQCSCPWRCRPSGPHTDVPCGAPQF